MIDFFKRLFSKRKDGVGKNGPPQEQSVDFCEDFVAREVFDELPRESNIDRFIRKVYKNE